jgi:hypothetical protein
MAAMLRTVKASPGCSPSVTDGHTRESEQANTMYCSGGREISHRQVGEKREQHVRKTKFDRFPMALIDKQVGRSSAPVISGVEDFWLWWVYLHVLPPKKAATLFEF